jgi:hypothetical protein
MTASRTCSLERAVRDLYAAQQPRRSRACTHNRAGEAAAVGLSNPPGSRHIRDNGFENPASTVGKTHQTSAFPRAFDIAAPQPISLRSRARPGSAPASRSAGSCARPALRRGRRWGTRRGLSEGLRLASEPASGAHPDATTAPALGSATAEGCFRTALAARLRPAASAAHPYARFASSPSSSTPKEGLKKRLAKRRRLDLWATSSQRSAPGWGSGRRLNGARARDQLGCLDWPCGQNPGRKLAHSRRA